LANDPPLIAADEPTGNLDSQTTAAIFELFSKLAKSGKTVLVVTHEREFSLYFENTINITDGVVTTTASVHD
jgi:putative ABC transport system ATP-binding protein